MTQRKVRTRYLLGLSSGIAVLLLVGTDGTLSVPSGTVGAEPPTQKTIHDPAGARKEPVEPVYSVVSPLGDPVVKMITMAPRLDTLAGKTVCMVWNEAFKADVTLPAIGESLKEKYADITVIPHTEIYAALQAAARENPSAEDEAILQAVLKEKGCEALISGNGG